MRTAIATEAGQGANQDRASVIASDDGGVIALADGAGGVGQGARAAQAWIDLVAASIGSLREWAEVIEELDGELVRRGPAGQTTAIVVVVTSDMLRGACVGDSAVWLVLDHEIVDLAERVRPKPLVGAGCDVFEIVPREFDRGTLLVASDGLVKYAGADEIAAIARGDDLDAAAAALVELVRLPSGALPDDTTVVLCRR